MSRDFLTELKAEADEIYKAYVVFLGTAIFEERDGRVFPTTPCQHPDALRVTLTMRNEESASEVEKLLFWAEPPSAIISPLQKAVQSYTGEDRQIQEECNNFETLYETAKSLKDWESIPAAWNKLMTRLKGQSSLPSRWRSGASDDKGKSLHTTFKALVPGKLIWAVTRVACGHQPIEADYMTEAERTFAIFFRRTAAKILQISVMDGDIEYLPKNPIENSLRALHQKLLGSRFVACHEVKVVEGGMVFVDGAEVTKMASKKALLAIAALLPEVGPLQVDRDAFVTLNRASAVNANRDFPTIMGRLKEEYCEYLHYSATEGYKRIYGLTFSQIDLRPSEIERMVSGLRRKYK